VTGIIEDRRQIEAFETAFQGSQYRQPEIDRPVYQSFEVERAEISYNTDEEKLRWEPRPVRPMYELKNRWSRTVDDPVNSKYYPPLRNGMELVFPLGPLVNDSWRENAGHPRIAQYETDLQEKTDAKPDILLVRYIDYDVEPGKKYRYRMKLTVQNPNWKVPEKYLQASSLSESRYLQTAWSQPTPVVSVQPDTRIELTAVDARRGFALVKLIHFDLPSGRNQTREFKVERGETMNYYNQEYYPPTDSAAPNESDMSLLFPSVRTPPPPQQVDYVTDMTLIDFQVAAPLPGRRVSNGLSSILLRDQDGNFTVLEEEVKRPSIQPKMPSRQLAAAPGRG
jgi:hypothetical protein